MRRRGPGYWLLLAIASAILLITMGARQTIGLFIAPLNVTTGLGIVAISLAAAIGQFFWELAQPVFGALADRFGPGRVSVLGALMLTSGPGADPVRPDRRRTDPGAGRADRARRRGELFSILIGSVLQRVPAEQRSFAAGLINTEGSFGTSSCSHRCCR